MSFSPRECLNGVYAPEFKRPGKEPFRRLPDSPDAPEYREVIEAVENGDNAAVSMADFATWCENDFWFANRFLFTFGDFICDDVHNKHYGKRWAEHPWVFDRCRDIQFDPLDVPRLRLWPRYSFKSLLVTQNHTIWDCIRNHDERGCRITTLIITFRLDEVGEGFLYAISKEIETNKKLYGHWPNLFYPDPKAPRVGSPEWTKTSIRLKQIPGVREPTVMACGLDATPVSVHFDRFKCDDLVVKRTTNSALVMMSTYKSIRELAPLGKDMTVKFYVGTHWRVGDPYETMLKDRMVALDLKDCYGPEHLPPKERTVPTLRSTEALNTLKVDMGPYNFAAQMRNQPTAESEQRFQSEWIVNYFSDPYKERLNGNVYVLIDPAGCRTDKSDYYTILIVKMGADGLVYVLDLYRDRFQVDEFMMLLFHLAGDSRAVDERKDGWAKWGPGDWRVPGGFPLKFYEESHGADRDIAHIKREMENRSFRFQLYPMPPDTLKKEERIRGWQTDISSGGKWRFPLRVGHSPKGDHRDTWQVFMEEEYRWWTPEGGVSHDDGLDILAMVSRKRSNPNSAPKMGDLLLFPVSESSGSAAGAILAQLHGHDTGPSSLSSGSNTPLISSPHDHSYSPYPMRRRSAWAS